MNNNPSTVLGICIAVIGISCFILMVIAGIFPDLGLNQEGGQG